MLACLFVCLSQATPAQDKGPLQFMPAPPPLKSVTRDERSQLDTARDTKSRMRATMEMAEARLSHAEQLAAGQQYEAACGELGSYQGLIENFFTFLNDKEPRKDKIRDVLKRLEMSLRAQSARIEAIRRVTPSEHAVNVKAILDFAYHARTEALNTFFGDANVMNVMEASPTTDKPLDDPTAKDTLSSAPDNQP
jgi:ABC-type transporter Mla subunit MlaD